ncbi:MAG: hypothetical protein JF606_18405 [Burkholderiales bacterium]|nr:hypothetical protein [Burkholderiales bacterium]
MFENTGPTLNRSFLLRLVERMLERDPHFLDALRRLLARDVVNGAKVEQLVITVSFDSAAVMAAFGRLDDITH